MPPGLTGGLSRLSSCHQVRCAFQTIKLPRIKAKTRVKDHSAHIPASSAWECRVAAKNRSVREGENFIIASSRPEPIVFILANKRDVVAAREINVGEFRRSHF